MYTFEELRETVELLKSNHIYPIKGQKAWSYRIVQTSPYSDRKVGSLSFISNQKILDSKIPLYLLIEQIKNKTLLSLHQRFLAETGMLDSFGLFQIEGIDVQWQNTTGTELQSDYSIRFENVRVPEDRLFAFKLLKVGLNQIVTPSGHRLLVLLNKISRSNEADTFNLTVTVLSGNFSFLLQDKLFPTAQ